MTFVRRNVWTLPSGDETLQWYSKAIEELQKRKYSDPTSWWSLAAMHGIDEDVWRAFGFIGDGVKLPTGPQIETLWDQCQHQTWFFLPWHRGYLAAFEAIVRDTVQKLGGPGDWSLPYWDYSADKRSLELPHAFAQANWPDGKKNYLYIARRYGAVQFPSVQKPLVLDRRAVLTANALGERLFQGEPGKAGAAGFGGIETPFWHPSGRGSKFGGLESAPHGPVHVLVGGGFRGNNTSPDPLELGLMTNPDTAALDPIFWLHHANIDRLWNVWLRQKPGPRDPPGAFRNSSETDWLDGPRDRKFEMPDVDGKIFSFTPGEVLDTTAAWLGYAYDDDATDIEVADRLTARFERLGASPELAAELSKDAEMAPTTPPSLLGASRNVRLNSDIVESKIVLDSDERQRLSKTLSISPGINREPDRVYLSLENVTSPTDAALFYVYVNLPEGVDPAEDTEHLAGSFAMFGVSKLSNSSASSGDGVSASFDITRIIDEVHAGPGLSDEVSVKIIAAVPGATSDEISVGRISRRSLI